MGWERIAYTRRELFDQVWAEPVMHVAKRIGISDVALAKVCRGMGIPLPGRGHWARKAAGNAPSKPTLGPAKSGAPLTYERQRYVGDAAEITAAAGVTAEVAGHVAASLPIAVPDVLTDPHPLKSARADHTRSGSPRSSTWSNASPLDPSPRPVCERRPSQRKVLPSFQRARWKVRCTMRPARGTSSSSMK